MENVTVGQSVQTPYGGAIVKIVDNLFKTVRVKHFKVMTPVTDFYFKDLQELNK